jgi:large subunit ribosomal protein L4e
MVKRTAKVFNLEGKSVGKIELPPVFTTPLRPDVIKRAVLAIQSSRRQPQGRDYMAGKRTTAESRGTGSGISRVPRLKGGGGRAAFAPGTVGGRLAFPPTPKKKIVKHIPKKEKRFALMSAIAATASKETVAARGHSIEDIKETPIVVTNDLENLKRTKTVEETLIRLGILSELYRIKESRKVRAGKGKRRGRRLKQAVGPLIIVNENKGIIEAAQNILGVETVTVTNLNAEMLAPGTHPGRLTIWTTDAINKLGSLYGAGDEE